ncbi:MAG: sigma-54 dependent transcriptional regulator [Polyangiales bacterium]
MTRPTSARILLVDDDEDARALMARALRGIGHQVIEAADGAEALRLDLGTFDAVLTDVQMPAVGGREVLAAVARASRAIPVVVFTGFATPEGAIDLIAEGAYDYLPRPVELPRLRLVLQRALDWRALTLENDSLRSNARPASTSTDVLVGTSPAMLDVYRVIAQVAPTAVPVLIAGESGTGKELIARMIHRRSGRTGAFLTVGVSALPEDALLAELFGGDGRPGLFERSPGATVLLDEVDALGARAQAKLLAVLEERAVVGVDGAKVPIDVRVLATTSRDLLDEQDAGRFRSDLLFRLQMVTITVPPLAARRDDIPVLVDHFLRHYAAAMGRPAPVLAPDARAALLSYDWPGNVRELAQVIQQAVLLSRGNALLRDDLPASLRKVNAPPVAAEGEAGWPTLAAVERRYIDRVLQHTGGNKTRAAEVLGIDRRTLSRLFARERAEQTDGAAAEG